MRIAFVTPYYWPEDFGAGVQCAEITKFLVERGHEVHVFTQMPNYPKGVVLEGYLDKSTVHEAHEGAAVHRVACRLASRESSLTTKALASWSFGHEVRRLFKDIGRFDVVFSVSPPPFAGLASAKLAVRNKCRLVVRVADIASHAVEGAGASRHPGAKILRFLETKMLRKAEHLCLAAEYFSPFIDETCGKGKPRTVVLDWADGDAICPQAKSPDLVKKFGLDGKFVVMYSGSIGYSSNLMPLISVANQLRNEPGIRFLIFGEGVKKVELEARVAELGLDNVQIAGLQPRELFPSVLALSDVQVISLTEEGAKSSGQGKLKTILAAGKPSIGILPATSNEARMLNHEQLGWAFSPEDTEGISGQLLALIGDSAGLDAASKRCREYFDSHFEAKTNLAKIAEILES